MLRILILFFSFSSSSNGIPLFDILVQILFKVLWVFLIKEIFNYKYNTSNLFAQKYMVFLYLSRILYNAELKCPAKYYFIVKYLTFLFFIPHKVHLSGGATFGAAVLRRVFHTVLISCFQIWHGF